MELLLRPARAPVCRPPSRDSATLLRLPGSGASLSACLPPALAFFGVFLRVLGVLAAPFIIEADCLGAACLLCLGADCLGADCLGADRLGGELIRCRVEDIHLRQHAVSTQ